MISVNELRLGNCVIFHKDETGEMYGPIGGIDFFNILKCQPVDPIPLTPEILNKCGFETDNDADEYGGANAWLIISTNFAEYDNQFHYFSKERILKFGYYNRVKIEYLHQLQNLYFALTGEELQIQL